VYCIGAPGVNTPSSNNNAVFQKNAPKKKHVIPGGRARLSEADCMWLLQVSSVFTVVGVTVVYLVIEAHGG